jgi:hypothetical protein
MQIIEQYAEYLLEELIGTNKIINVEQSFLFHSNGRRSMPMLNL